MAAEARALSQLGHPLTVYAHARSEAPADDAIDVPVRYREDESRLDGWLALASVCLRHPIRCAADLAARRRWRREEHPTPLRRLAPSILRLSRAPGTRLHVHFAGPAALDALRVSRILAQPWSLTAHAYDIYLTPRNLPEKLRAAAVVTSGCDYTVSDLRDLAGPEAAARIHRIVMGVDLARFTRTRPHPAAPAVLAVGRLVEKKGFVDLIRAAATPALLARSATIRIVGEGPLRTELAAEIDRLGLAERVTLVGALTQVAVQGELEEAALLAMPCVVAASGDRDSMPVVVKEALAMEVPVVLADEVGLPEIACPAFSRLVPSADPSALGAAVAELLDLSPGERAAMGRAGRRFVAEHADVETESARLSELLVALWDPGYARHPGGEPGDA